MVSELWQKARVAAAVAILPSLDSRPIEETAIDLYRAWDIGDKSTNKERANPGGSGRATVGYASR